MRGGGMVSFRTRQLSPPEVEEERWVEGRERERERQTGRQSNFFCGVGGGGRGEGRWAGMPSWHFLKADLQQKEFWLLTPKICGPKFGLKKKCNKKVC